MKTLRSRTAIAIAAATAVLCLSIQGEVAADDTAFFSSSVPPNVVLIVDNSLSMNSIVWHPAFPGPDVYYNAAGCAAEGDAGYDKNCVEYPLCGDVDSPFVGLPTAGVSFHAFLDAAEIGTGLTDTICGNLREVFTDPAVEALTSNDDTYWDEKYLEWYFSDNVEVDHDGNGTTILQEIVDTNNGTRPSCAVDASHPVQYDLYRRARVTAAKDVLREVICQTSTVANIRYGLAQFESETDPEGGYLSVPVADYDTTQQAALEAAIDNITGDTKTPLGETLYNVYRYFMSRTSTETALGKDDTTRFPVYNLDTSGGTSGTVPPTPVTDPACQKNFVVLLTDGEPTYDDFDNMGQFTFVNNLIGDFHTGDGETETGDLYVDDVAKFMQTRDLLPSTTDTEVIDVYTVGFTTNATANSLLSRTADNGNGEFFYSTSAEDLTDAISGTLAAIVVKAKSFTAATVPASRATDGNNFFASYFNPAEDDPFWQGHLKTFEFNRAGEIRDKPTSAQMAANQPGDCALADPVSGRCLSGPLDLTKDGYWDAANEIPSATARDLYVSRYQSGPPSTIPSTPDDFDESTVTAADLGVTAADIASYTGVGNGTSGITTDEELADAIVRYLRGCEFGSGSCVDRGDGNKLWDIFHSNPVVVGPPNQGLSNLTYREFVTRYKYRKRVIYAGSNGGFVHGFNAGEYDTTLVPDAYDRGDGTEEMGFMAYPARQNIAELPLDDPPRGTPTWNGYSMDGSPVASDVWLYPDANQNPDDYTTNGWNNWRSVIIGGMREGGEVVYALDVTNPPDHNSSGGEQALGPAYPSYLWEFPCEDATDTLCTGTGYLPTSQVLSDYVAETWSEPVITRVRVRLAGTCTPMPCPVYDRWVAIFGGGYDPSGDPNTASYDATVADGTSRKGRAIFMVDITTGEVLGMRRFDNNASDGDTAMRFAFAASPAVFDLNFDGYADVAYFGDLGGNLWKWVLTDDTIDPINGSGGDEEHRWDGTDGWKFLKIMTAASCGPIDGCTGAAPAPAPHYRSFFLPPAGALVGSELWLVIGSGERTRLDYAGSLAAERNRLYVFHDQDPLEREVSLPAAGVARYTDAGASPHFADGTSLTGCAFPAGSVGYYIEGEDGEKFITNSEIFFGVVLTSSYKPIASAALCSSAGEGFLYGFDLFCADGALPDPGNPGSDTRRVAIGAGLPNQPRVSVGPVDGGGGGGGPCEDRVVVITSDGEAFTECPGGRPDSGVRINSWRDRGSSD